MKNYFLALAAGLLAAVFALSNLPVPSSAQSSTTFRATISPGSVNTHNRIDVTDCNGRRLIDEHDTVPSGPRSLVPGLELLKVNGNWVPASVSGTAFVGCCGTFGPGISTLSSDGVITTTVHGINNITFQINDITTTETINLNTGAYRRFQTTNITLTHPDCPGAGVATIEEIGTVFVTLTPVMTNCSINVTSNNLQSPFTMRPSVPGFSNLPLDLRVLVKDTNDATKTYPDAVLEFLDVKISANSGGHDHNDARPKGTFTRVNPTNTDGSIIVKYVAPAQDNAPLNGISGATEFRITARIPNGAVCTSSAQTINVKVDGLGELLPNGVYNLVGSVPGKHESPNNHYGTTAFNEALTRLAFSYFIRYGDLSTPSLTLNKLSFNDMSLPWGGLFDVGGLWAPSHHEHRLGLNLDLRTIDKPDGPGVPVLRRPALKQLIWQNGMDILVHTELGSNNHWHLTYNPGGMKCVVKLPGGSTAICNNNNILNGMLSVAPTTQSSVSVVATSHVTPSNGLFTYQYSFRNESSSAAALETIIIPLMGSVALNVTAPQGWTSNISKDGALVTFTATELTQLPAGFVDDGNSPPSPFQIAPGQTLSGFSFQSMSSAAPVDFYAQGYAPLPSVSIEDPVTPGSLDGLFKGTTQGPIKPVSGSLIDDTPYFVRQHYLDFLNREPDASGFQFWVNEVAGCGSNVGCREVKTFNVSAAYFLSIEFQETGYLLYRIYKAAFGDINPPAVPVPIRHLEFLPETMLISNGVQVGIADWEQKLEANKNAFADNFVARARFMADYPTSMTSAQFVDKLNTRAGIPLTTSERNALVSGLTNGTMSRAQVLRAVADDQTLKDAEFRKAFVLMQYFGYLRRNPDDAPDNNFDGFNFWLNKLNQFNGNFVNAEMVKAFILSGEYRRRFGE